MGGSRRSTLAILVLLLAYVLVYFHRTMTGVMKPEVEYYSEYYGIDANTLLALMSSAYFYAYAGGQVFMGALVDYYGVRRVGLVMLAMLGVATLVMGLPNPIALILGRVLVGLSATVVFISYMRSSALGFGIGSQGRLSSYALLAGSISTILATYPLRLMLNTIGLPSTLTLLALTAFILATLVYLVSSDTGGKSGGRTLSSQALMIARMARSPHSWGVGIAAVASNGIGLAYQSSWGQTHLSGVFMLDKNTVSEYLMILAVVFALTSIPTGYLSDMFKRRKPFLLASTIVATAAWSLMYLSSIGANATLLLLSLVLVGVSQGLHVIAPTMAKEIYSPEISGTATAFFNIVFFTGVALLQSVCSLLDPKVSILINTSIALAGVVVTLLLVKETYHK